MSAGEASSLASAQKRSRQEQQHDGPTIAVPAPTPPEEGRASSSAYCSKMKGAPATGGGVPGVLAVPASMAMPPMPPAEFLRRILTAHHYDTAPVSPPSPPLRP